MRCKGFTLLETLVALAVIAIAMGAALRSTYLAIDTIGDLKARSAAAWVAQNVINEIQATQLFPEFGTRNGKATQGLQTFQWRQDVTPTQNTSFRRVEVSVSLPEDPEHHLARQVSYVARKTN
ncbi:type II secretion system minor pseudopilin GspI [Propionivibrio dicarboxylicus]|nr:type II secretion system minor pseudopilin GspI [Propionivibrio dicarboxylicus]